MTAVVADTHTIIWYLRESNRLSEVALSALEGAIRSGSPVYISAISVVEVVYLVERYRLPEIALQQLVNALSESGTGLLIAPLDLGISSAIAEVSRDLVPDMPDRIIAATALYLNLPLVTRDLRIRALTNLVTIW